MQRSRPQNADMLVDRRRRRATVSPATAGRARTRALCVEAPHAGCATRIRTLTHALLQTPPLALMPTRLRVSHCSRLHRPCPRTPTNPSPAARSRGWCGRDRRRHRPPPRRFEPPPGPPGSAAGRRQRPDRGHVERPRWARRRPSRRRAWSRRRPGSHLARWQRPLRPIQRRATRRKPPVGARQT